MYLSCQFCTLKGGRTEHANFGEVIISIAIVFYVWFILLTTETHLELKILSPSFPPCKKHDWLVFEIETESWSRLPFDLAQKNYSYKTVRLKCV